MIIYALKMKKTFVQQVWNNLVLITHFKTELHKTILLFICSKYIKNLRDQETNKQACL